MHESLAYFEELKNKIQLEKGTLMQKHIRGFIARSKYERNREYKLMQKEDMLSRKIER